VAVGAHAEQDVVDRGRCAERAGQRDLVLARGDVRIELAGPSGRTYLLKANGPGTKFQPYYTVDLSSETKNGTWQLLVRDRSEGDAGALESWAITLPKK
jgi:subtilisin-like proprotein convertase family protein